MTAPDRTTWTVAEDPNGDLTLFCDRVAVRRRFEVTEVEWDVLTRVLAPDEATVERLARALHSTCYEGVAGFSGHLEADRSAAEAMLAALAGTSAQARHTDDDAAGGGEHA